MTDYLPFIASVISSLLVMCGTIYSVNRKQDQTRALLAYRIDQLEKKQDKYNHLQERLLACEIDKDHITREVLDLKEKIS